MAHTLELVAPGSLLVDTNIRTDASLTPAFVANVKANGVLQAITAHRDAEGGLRVLYGQRRTLAAVEAGLDTVPVYVVDTLEEADRIATQVAENDQRAAITDAERAEAFHQLALLGVSAGQIAKRAGADKATVERAMKARSTDAGTAALSAGRTLDQALVLAEFADDPEATDQIEAVIEEEPDMLDHTAQRLRDERERARQLAAVAAEYEARGLTVVEHVGWSSEDEAVGLSYLTDAEGNHPDEDAANAVSLRHHWDGTLQASLGITGWAEQGYTAREPYRSTERQTGPMTEEQKAERKALIANNKAMESATKVRRDWLQTFLARKAVPKGWAQFLAVAHTRHYQLAGERDASAAADLAGCAPDGGSDWYGSAIADYAETHPTRAHVPLLALAFAGFEKNMPKDCWRSPRQGCATTSTSWPHGATSSAR
ncbi:ParB/RepB/Spo0J family partition protein [Sinomonas atrocyanea]